MGEENVVAIKLRELLEDKTIIHSKGRFYRGLSDPNLPVHTAVSFVYSQIKSLAKGGGTATGE